MGAGVNTETPCPPEQYAILDEREAVKQLLPWATKVECTEAGGTYVDEEEDVPCELNTEDPPHCLVLGGDCTFIPMVSEVIGVTCELNAGSSDCSSGSDSTCEYVSEVLEVSTVTCDLNNYGTACSDSSGDSCVYRGPQTFESAGANLHGVTSWISGKQREWPPQFLDFCKWTLDQPDWYDRGDGANAINNCPAWLREHETMLELVEKPAQQGVQHELKVLQTFSDSCAAAILSGGGASDCPASCVYTAHQSPACAGTNDGTADTSSCTAPNPCAEEVCSEDELILRNLLSTLTATKDECEAAGGIYSAGETAMPCALNYHSNGCRVDGGNCVFTKAVPESCVHDCAAVDLGDLGDSSADCPADCVYTRFPESCLPPSSAVQQQLRDVACTTTGNAPLAGGMTCVNHDFLYLNVTVKETLVSGSPLLYGPVGLSSCGVGDPIMNVIDTEYFPHNIKGGSGPDPGKAIDHSGPEKLEGFWTVDGEGATVHVALVLQVF
jgi:hypothetical protein